MTDTLKINKINTVIESYFKNNESVTIIPVKNLMPDFINAGIFPKDYKNGFPIRKVLRELDEANQLSLIPNVYAEKNEQSTYWYFIPTNAPVPTTPYKQNEKSEEAKKSLAKRANSDESYVIDLCDKVIGEKADRQKRFSFLLGDLHRDGKTRTRLPVDAYYETLNLVVEFMESQDAENVPIIDKPEKKTVSGVTRDEQRLIYEKRRFEVLPEHNIEVLAISYADFEHDSKNELLRNKDVDLEIVKEKLSKYLGKNE